MNPSIDGGYARRLESSGEIREWTKQLPSKRVIHVHSTDNPQSEEEVEVIKTRYIDFLYKLYPQLEMLNREEVSSLSSRDLHHILLPEMSMRLAECQVLRDIMQGYASLIQKIL